jgi:SSS family solute:Na+ symporter
MQSIIVWAISVVLCVVVSLLTEIPSPEKVTDELTMNWKRLNIFSQLGAKWYTSVILWWGLFAAVILGLMLVFSGAILS